MSHPHRKSKPDLNPKVSSTKEKCENPTSLDDHNNSEFDRKLHPLLIPSVLDILFENLHSGNANNSRLVCKTWDKLLQKRLNPFLNKRILSNLIEYLPQDSVRSSRLVCSLWNTSIVGSSRWTKPGINRDGIEEDIFFRVGLFYTRTSTYEKLERFHEKFANFLPVLPLPLAFSHATLRSSVTLRDEIPGNFLRNFGHAIKYLHMQRCDWEFAELREILFGGLCPNLEGFKLTCGILPGTKPPKKKSTESETESFGNLILLHENENIPILQKMKSLSLDVNFLDTKDNPRPYVEQFLLEFIKSCPNLETFHCDVAPWYTRTLVTDIISRNRDIPLKHLTHIVSIVDPNLPQMKNLRLRNFPLTTLRIRIRYRDVTLTELHNLLRSFKDTLTFLHLVFLTYACAQEFPSAGDLHRLKSLHLHSFKGQLDFLKDFQSLEDLLLGSSQAEIRKQKVFNGRAKFKQLLPKLKKFAFADDNAGMEIDRAIRMHYP